MIKIPQKKITTITSFYGGPSAGKSTSAAALYAIMKARGMSVELVREYIKEWIWDKRPLGIYEQLYITAKQLRRVTSFLGKVDYIITDSPVWLNSFYSRKYGTQHIHEGCEAMCKAYYQQVKSSGHRFLNLWQTRAGKYEQAGRASNEQQARIADVEMKKYFKDKGLLFTEQRGTTAELEIIAYYLTKE